MPLAPEMAVSPLQQAPPDRPTVQLEDWARQGEALLFADRKLDDQERKILYAFISRITERAAQAGGIGMGNSSPPPGPDGGLPPSPGEMNQNTEDMGSVEGATAEEEQ